MPGSVPPHVAGGAELTGFADIPGHVRGRVAAGERVLLILLDAFGLAFLDRVAAHPFARRLVVTPLRSQFPSTTTAHVTTLHFGLPVEQHGLYEWNVYEPSLGEVIAPLRYATAGGVSLVDRLTPDVLAPGPTFYETLDVPSLVLMPSAIAFSPYSRLACAGARVVGFDRLEAGLAAALDAFDDPEVRFAYLYWDFIDATGHHHGPSSPAFGAAIDDALNALASAFRDRREGVSVMLTADHGQVDVDQERVDYLDIVWPELTGYLTVPRPAGSSRDVFLHVRDESAAAVVAALGERLEGRAVVRPAAELFIPPIGPRLAARLGNVAVLPAEGRQAWLAATPGNETWFRGQHGGLSEVETSTYLAELVE